MKLLNKLGASFDYIISSAAVFSGALVILLMLGVVANVTGRSFGSSIVGVEEVSEYFLLWLTFAGTAWVLKRGKHVKIDVLTNYLPSKAQAVLNVILSIIAAVIFLFIAWYGFLTIADYIQRGVYMPQILRLPKGIVWAIVPLGSLLLAIQSLRNVYNGFRNLNRR
jgi:TRAP-type C4-dicarboxylate transport system permease small subunit